MRDSHVAIKALLEPRSLVRHQGPRRITKIAGKAEKVSPTSYSAIVYYFLKGARMDHNFVTIDTYIRALRNKV